MKILAKNTNVTTTEADIAPATVSFLESPQKLTIESTSVEDDANGEKQVETATASGTITGQLQVETATIVGTIDPAGAGEIEVVLSSDLVDTAPITLNVAVANDDTASAVALKVKTALNNNSKIADYYEATVSGADVILTAKEMRNNDDALNIAYSNGTASGLTPDATSAHTTEGFAGTGNAEVVVTSALFGSPETISVSVARNDSPSVWAAKVRTLLAANDTVSEHFTVSGSGTAIKLTAKEYAANDSSLNIAISNDTCHGIDEVVSSENTTAGVAGTGIHTVEITGVNEKGQLRTELVKTNGTASVSTVNKYRGINGMRAVKAGTYNKAKGAVKLKYSSSVISQIVADETQSCQAVYTSESGKTSRVSYLYAKCVASSASVNTTLKFMIKKQGQPWVVEAEYVFTGTGDKEFVLSDFLPEIPQLATMKITAVTSTGTASVSVNMTIV